MSAVDPRHLLRVQVEKPGITSPSDCFTLVFYWPLRCTVSVPLHPPHQKAPARAACAPCLSPDDSHARVLAGPRPGLQTCAAPTTVLRTLPRLSENFRRPGPAICRGSAHQLVAPVRIQSSNVAGRKTDPGNDSIAPSTRAGAIGGFGHAWAIEDDKTLYESISYIRCPGAARWSKSRSRSQKIKGFARVEAHFASAS